jgi:hypothetical protein
VNGIENFPTYLITSESETCELVMQQWLIVGKPHAVNVLYNECNWANLPKCSIELLVEIIDAVVIIASPALAISLTWVASNKDICFLECVNFSNVSMFNGVILDNLGIQLTGASILLVCPDRFYASVEQTQVTTTAARKKRNCRIVKSSAHSEYSSIHLDP